MKDIAPEILQKRWLHSHEEDTDSQMVFRPASFAFPPSRGRAGFELKPDQSLIDIGIAPTDGSQETAGKWKVDGDKILFFKSSGTKPARTLQIISADNNRLVVKK